MQEREWFNAGAKRGGMDAAFRSETAKMLAAMGGVEEKQAAYDASCAADLKAREQRADRLRNWAGQPQIYGK